MKDNDYIIIDTNDCDVPKEGNDIYESRKNVAELISKKNGILVSILVIAYNRIEKTKNCIDSIIRYTDDVNYELILVDNGSNDGTLEYFKAVEVANKKIIHITKNLQLSFGILQGTKYCNGAYIAFLNNDMIVTSNWLSNIMKCFDSDRRIGMVCTDSLNVTNFQNADISFSDFDEMQKKAKEYNVSEPKKWNERLRLITSGAVYKRECIEICGNWDYGFFHDFADDDLSFHIRRAGYKIILCKDVFVHHDHDFKSMNDETIISYQKSLEKGRENFKSKYFGIDAWDDANNFEFDMMSMLKKSDYSSVDVLGIDVKCGAPVLEVKNSLKKYDIFDTYLSAFTEDAKYYIDLKTICEGYVQCDRIEYISEYFLPKSFDYIILGKSLNLYSEPLKALNDILNLVKDDGQVLLKLRNVNSVETLINIWGNHFTYDKEHPVCWTLDDFHIWIQNMNFKIDRIIYEQHGMEEDSRKNIENLCKEINMNDDAINRVLTKDFIISLSRQ